MAATTLARMRQLVGTAAEWAANDLVIGDGEIALETQAAGDHRLKIGDGVRRYADLPYFTLGMAPAKIRLDDGTQALPAWSFAAETGTGMYRAGAGILAASVQGMKVAQWTSAGYTGALASITGPASFTGVISAHAVPVSINLPNPDAEILWGPLPGTPVGAIGHISSANVMQFKGYGAGGVQLTNLTTSVRLAAAIFSPAAAASANLGSGTLPWNAGFIQETVSVGTALTLARLTCTAPLAAGAVIDAAFFCQNSVANPTTGQGARIYLGSIATPSRAAVIEAAVSNVTNGHHLAFKTNPDGAIPIERVRIDALGNVINNVNTSAAALATNSTMVFQLTSNTSLQVRVRGTDGVTRVGNITLA